MTQDAQLRTADPSPLSTARYLHDALGDLAKLAQSANLEATEVMILAARIEALNAIRRYRADGPGAGR